MKSIQRNSKKISFNTKGLVFLGVIFFISSLFFSIKFSDHTKGLEKLKFVKTIDPPESNDAGGFNNAPFFFSFLNKNNNLRIYYTLDGSKPDLSSQLYISPIRIEDRSMERNDLSMIPTSPRWKPPIGNVYKGTVIRAISVDSKMNKSKEFTRTFFISEKGNHRYAMPVISITIDPDDFFGYKNGIYVLGKNYWDKDNYVKKSIDLDIPWWEYPSNYLDRGNNSDKVCFLEFFDNSGKKGFESEVKIRINGNATRGFPQKSLRISFGAKNGLPLLNYDLFVNGKKSNFQSFILRNGGNDWNKTMFRDGFMQSLMRNSDVETQQYRPAIVFINGEYWGIHEIREKVDQDFFKNKYGIPKDSIEILEGIANLYSGNNSIQKEFQNLLSFVQTNDLSKDVNFEYVKKKIDLNSFMDIIIANVYFCNNDWPGNNVRFWRFTGNSSGTSQNKFKDGRWRWILNDTDWGFGLTGRESYEYNMLIKAQKVGSVGILFSGLMKNSAFRTLFVEKFKGYLNTIFQPQRIIRKIDSVKSILSPEINEHIYRWRMTSGKDEWDNNVIELNDFAAKRFVIQIDQLNDFFGLKDSSKLKLEYFNSK